MTIERRDFTMTIEHGTNGRVGYVTAWTLVANGHEYRLNSYRDQAYGRRLIAFDLATDERVHTWHFLPDGRLCDAGGFHGHYEHPEMKV